MRNQPFEQRALQHFRKLLFPAITQGIITGYNVYHQREESNAPYTVNYLHSDLGFLPNGRPQPHREELLEKLVLFGPVDIKEKIHDSLIDRIATYKIGDWEENPDLQFYNAQGKLLTLQEVESEYDIIIGEGRQYDLEIKLISQRDCKNVLDLFQKFTFKYRLNKKGTISKELNSDAITDAWKIPLILIKSSRKQRLFLPITELVMQHKNYQASSLMKNIKPLTKYLQQKKVAPHVRNKLVNKAFIASYLDVE